MSKCWLNIFCASKISIPYVPLQRVKKMDECCLCIKDLSASVAYKKRKKLHGESASVARTMLNEFCVLEIGAGLDDIIEVSDKSVFLCCQCDSQLSRFSRLQQELQLLKISITTAIRSLHLKTTTADISDISAFDQSVCSAIGTDSHSSLLDVSSLDVLGTSAENITCNTTSTVSTPCSASVSRKRSAETDGDDDDDNENDHERSENVAVCNTSPQVQVN